MTNRVTAGHLGDADPVETLPPDERLQGIEDGSPGDADQLLQHDQHVRIPIFPSYADDYLRGTVNVHLHFHLRFHEGIGVGVGDDGRDYCAVHAQPREGAVVLDAIRESPHVAKVPEGAAADDDQATVLVSVVEPIEYLERVGTPHPRRTYGRFVVHRAQPEILAAAGRVRLQLLEECDRPARHPLDGPFEFLPDFVRQDDVSALRVSRPRVVLKDREEARRALRGTDERSREVIEPGADVVDDVADDDGEGGVGAVEVEDAFADVRIAATLKFPGEPIRIAIAVAGNRCVEFYEVLFRPIELEPPGTAGEVAGAAHVG